MGRSPAQGTGPLIYNLFHRLVGSFDQWGEHADRAAAMGFDWLYFNPIFYPGFSGSLYAVKDFARLDPAAVPPEAASDRLEAVAPALERIKAAGLRPMIDLVVNHTAKDSELVTQHPDWYARDERGRVLSPFAIDPADARKKTVWGDLAELDYEGTPDLEGLRGHVERVVATCQDVGFEGFRCDAAYKVPRDLWRWVIDRARERRPGTLFVAETLGCRPREMLGLKGAGFDSVMNSSKYWAFDAPWCLEQHEEWQSVAPSISFPESHDTPRLAQETGGLERVARQRMALAAFFSEGLLVPVGFELGFRRRLNVVRTRPDHWEEPSYDLRGFIKGTLELKRSSEALSREGHHRPLTPLDRSTLALEKRSGTDRAILLINKDWHQAQALELAGSLERWPGGGVRLVRPCLDDFTGEHVAEPRPIRLEPAEIAVAQPVG